MNVQDTKTSTATHDPSRRLPNGRQRQRRWIGEELTYEIVFLVQ